ncbi:MAG: DNA-processing protein DprA [Acidimicrobiia bacterium]|nr:DNA-processing protein DprA [Acidimicrobiia bacterium]MDX2467540.1 DNA-processing protein DprA [Acidimicrobiia bacterium]
MTAVDTMTALVLASRLGDRQRPSLPAGEWHKLVAVLSDVGMSANDLFDQQQSLSDLPALDPELADRLTMLLEGSGSVAFEYEELRRRGVEAIAIGNEAYPERLSRLLANASPPVLFSVGDCSLLSRGGVAIVGSRNVSPDGAEVAKAVARQTVELGLPVVSGGARGVDQLAMNAAFMAGGTVVGVLADSLLQRIRKPDILRAIDSGNTCLVTQQHPDVGFSPAAAMARNKIVYALSDLTVVVATDEGSGGTWAGAVESLSRGFGRVAVWRGAGEGPGNAALEPRGAIPIRDVAELHQLVATEPEDPPEQLSMLG